MPKSRYREIAEYYDAENAHHRMLQEDVPFLLRQMPRKPQRVLELAVGTGRVAIPLAQAGHRVIGIDYDRAMLDIARRKRDAVGLRDRQLLLLQADALDFDLGKKFDWICMLFNTFLLFTTLARQDAVLANVRRHLKPAGRFWLDIFQPDLQLLASSRRTDLDPAIFFVPELDRSVLKTADLRRGNKPQVQHVAFNYTWFDPQQQECKLRREFEMTYLFPRELQILLERNGLKIERLFGNYDGSSVHPLSPRLIARCSRI